MYKRQIDSTELDAAPRGSGLLVAPPSAGQTPRVACKAVTHYSVKWPWVRAGGGPHVLRVSYGRAGVQTVEPTLGETLADVETLFGVRIGVEQVRATRTVRFANSLPPHTPAHRARVAELTAALDGLPGLALTGSWFAGTGLAAVLPQAAEAARRLVGGATVRA